jgi:transcriptional regulator with GAF, ATPase, and Fis domain
MPRQTNTPAAEPDTTLRSIMEGTARAQGEDFFRSLVQYLAVSLDVKAAFVAEFAQEKKIAQTLSVWVNGQHVPNFEFELKATPCEGILNGEIRHYRDDIQSLFPDNALLIQLAACSYLAIPLKDENGSVVGHLAIIDDEPLAADERQLSIFHIFAARATGELICRRAVSKLDDSREREQQLRQDRERAEAELFYLREELRSRSELSEIVGESDGIWRVLRNIDMVAPTGSTVLILGETGTGKELVARAIHGNSKRRNGPFVRVNCPAMAESLLESELFGHEDGAFTGATGKRTGRFELADGGTIFLDEIGEMPLSAQSRLLRVLQEQELERVGGSETIRIDTRVVAATNRDLLAMSENGKFREDLYYRLNVFPIQIPPLRERTEDIPTLVRCFLNKLASRLGKKIENVAPSVLAALEAYHWPGNVRELENVIERAMIVSTGDSLLLPEGISQTRKQKRSDKTRTLAEVEADHIRLVLSHSNGVVGGPKGAAQILDLNPNTLHSRMKKLGIKAT